MKTLKLTQKLAFVAFLISGNFAFAQIIPADSTEAIQNEIATENEETMSNRDETFNPCIDKFGNQILGTPHWSSTPGQIVTSAECPGNIKVGIQAVYPEANLHIRSGLANFAESTVLLIENNHEKILKLNNQGTLYSREIRVNLDQWPDYVFDDNYELISLDSLQNYINTYGHLPNIPAANEIETDGLNLGESNKFLMEKIEELTLYLLEQQKEQEGIKSTLEQQQELLKIQQELLLKQSLLIQELYAQAK